MAAESTTRKTTETKPLPFNFTLPRNLEDTPDSDTLLESYKDYAEKCRSNSSQ